VGCKKLCQKAKKYSCGIRGTLREQESKKKKKGEAQLHSHADLIKRDMTTTTQKHCMLSAPEVDGYGSGIRGLKTKNKEKGTNRLKFKET